MMFRSVFLLVGLFYLCTAATENETCSDPSILGCLHYINEGDDLSIIRYIYIASCFCQYVCCNCVFIVL